MNTIPDNGSQLTNEERLVHETKFYQQLFDKMAIEGDMSHGYTWSLGGKNRARQIDIVNQKERPLTPTELGILAISLSIREGSDQQGRIAIGFFLQHLGIVNADDIIEFATDMTKRTKGEHATKPEYLKNCTENAQKIIILRRAYESLQKERVELRLKDEEDRIILGYVIAILGSSYEMRPYMIDRTLTTESWVDVYDHLFDNFSEKSSKRYRDAGYESLYALFLNIRNEIADKKRIKRVAISEYAELCKRIGVGVHTIYSIQSPLLASSRQQDPQSPETP